MGRVFEARHVKLERRVALKILRPDHANDPDLLRRFFQEARTVNRVNHPHIVQIFDFVEEVDDDGQRRAACVMELLEGQTLAEVLDEGPLPLERIVRIIEQVSRALAAAHDVGVIHRDVKPENVFLTRDAEGREFVKVLDFGVAKLTRADPGIDAKETYEGALVGTPRYMSPEQAASLGVDARTDIYGVGCLLYQMLSGRPPFEGDTFNTLVAQLLSQPPPALGDATAAGEALPDGLGALALQCLAKDPGERPASLEEVRTRATDAVWRSDDRRRARPRALLAGATLAIVGFCILALRPTVEASPQPQPEPELTPLMQSRAPSPIEPYLPLVTVSEPAASLVQAEAVEAPTAVQKAAATTRGPSARRSAAATHRGSRDAVLNPFDR